MHGWRYDLIRGDMSKLFGTLFIASIFAVLGSLIYRTAKSQREFEADLKAGQWITVQTVVADKMVDGIIPKNSQSFIKVQIGSRTHWVYVWRDEYLKLRRGDGVFVSFNVGASGTRNAIQFIGKQ